MRIYKVNNNTQRGIKETEGVAGSTTLGSAGRINSCMDAKLDENGANNIGIVMPGAVVAKARQLGNWFDLWYLYSMVT